MTPFDLSIRWEQTSVDQVVGKLGESISLQLDESTDVSGKAQLIAFVRYIDTDISEHILWREKTS